MEGVLLLPKQYTFYGCKYHYYSRLTDLCKNSLQIISSSFIMVTWRVKCCVPGARVRNGMKMRLHGQAVKTSPFHGGNTGSIPVGVIKSRKDMRTFSSVG